MEAILAGTDRSQTKNEIRDLLIENAAFLKVELSRAKASKAADLFKRGRMDEMDELMRRATDYADPTGERATENVLRAAA